MTSNFFEGAGFNLSPSDFKLRPMWDARVNLTAFVVDTAAANKTSA